MVCFITPVEVAALRSSLPVGVVCLVLPCYSVLFSVVYFYLIAHNLKKIKILLLSLFYFL